MRVSVHYYCQFLGTFDPGATIIAFVWVINISSGPDRYTYLSLQLLWVQLSTRTAQDFCMVSGRPTNQISGIPHSICMGDPEIFLQLPSLL